MSQLQQLMRTAAIDNSAPNSARQLLQQLDDYRKMEAVRPLDYAFVAFLHYCDATASPWVLLAALLVSERLGAGHVCLDLAQTWMMAQKTARTVFVLKIVNPLRSVVTERLKMRRQR